MTTKDFIKNPHLSGEDFFWQGNHIGILLIHGFTATTTEVRLIAEKLHKAGYTTAGPLLPGHGTHPDDLNRAKWPMWLEKVKKTYENISRNCKSVYVIGESMGALLAIELTVEHPEIAGLMLFAPAIKIKNPWLVQFLSLFKQYVEKNKKDDGLPWKGYTVNPLKAGVELLRLQNITRQHLHKITQPTLVFTGEYDESIAPESARIVLQGISSNEKCHLHMANSGHTILIDHELEDVFKSINAFIKTHHNYFQGSE